MWAVIDNVTDSIVRSFDSEDSASWLCRGLNLQAGPGGRYKVKEMSETYMIVRFRFRGHREVIVRGLTLEQAQEHCNRDDTHGEGWFDGYEVDNGG